MFRKDEKKGLGNAEKSNNKREKYSEEEKKEKKIMSPGRVKNTEKTFA